jgi:carboxylesterase type B
MGESAGGGSILLQAAAYGGKNGSAPFSQVILQSPAIAPPISATDEVVYNGFLSQLGVSTLAEARALSAKDIILGNARQVSASNQTSYTYGPIVDGVFSPAEVSQLYQNGLFDKNIKVFSAHNYFEGSFFFDPKVTTNVQFRRWVQSSMPGLSTINADYAADILYPHLFDGSLGYVDAQTRQMVLWAEAVINCNWLLSNDAFNGSSYACEYIIKSLVMPHALVTDTSFADEFSVSPGIHAEDQKYTFNDFLIPPTVPSAQATLQYAIMSFVSSGVPVLNSEQLNGTWPQWGSDRTVINIGANGPVLSKSSIGPTRCDWWNQGRFTS